METVGEGQEVETDLVYKMGHKGIVGLTLVEDEVHQTKVRF